MENNNPVICAIDTADIERAKKVVSEIKPYVGAIKLGLEFYIAHGSDGIKEIAEQEVPIFLDLKLHDIPNTVSKAMSVISTMDMVFMTTIHTLGGREMIRAAVEAAGGKVKVVGVTVLTSMDDKNVTELGISKTAGEEVVYLATAAKNHGLSGVVCSAYEIGKIRDRFGAGFEIVVPGIRPENVTSDDQKRIVTPKQAINMGANYLVIGRPITNSDNPAGAAELIYKSIS